ncbi:MAG: hypothetical protein FD119_121 [Stygiobacter sp.]|nr:MAG: hypothetical protein FD119_121 [Stygiobacter sp.]
MVRADPDFTFGALMGKNRQLAQANGCIDELVDGVNQRNARIAQLEAQLAEMQALLVKSESNAKACAAQAKALLDENPNTELMADSGVPYKSKPGNKTKLRRIYEEAFDAAARERGVAQPELIRVD